MFSKLELKILLNIIEEYLDNYTENEQKEHIEIFNPIYKIFDKINFLEKTIDN